MSNGNFYIALENRFRGSRESIRGRLQVYTPLFRYLDSAFAEQICGVDLGCGRGEWLEILREANVTATGVDLDEDMLSACRGLALTVEHADVLSYLKSQSGDSLHLISAFHIAEHLSFDMLLELVAESFRVLKAGGLLIVETPNPENPIVGSCNFYLDPTHRNPLPPLLLSFVTEFHGFRPGETIRLQQRKEIAADEPVGIEDVLYGASADFAIVAQKPCDDERNLSFTDFFEAPSHLTASGLSQRYDNTLRARLEELQDRADNTHPDVNEMMRHVLSAQEASKAEAVAAAELRKEIELKSADLEKQAKSVAESQAALRASAREIEQLKDRERALNAEWEAALRESAREIEQLRDREKILDAELNRHMEEVSDLQGHSHHWWVAATRHQEEISALKSSWSWRATAPFRLIAASARQGFGALWHAVAALRHFLFRLLRTPAEWAIRLVLARPGLTERLYPLVIRFPRLHITLRDFARTRQLIAMPHSKSEGETTGSHTGTVGGTNRNMTDRAMRIYRQLERDLGRPG